MRSLLPLSGNGTIEVTPGDKIQVPRDPFICPLPTFRELFPGTVFSISKFFLIPRFRERPAPRVRRDLERRFRVNITEIQTGECLQRETTLSAVSLLLVSFWEFRRSIPNSGRAA